MANEREAYGGNVHHAKMLCPVKNTGGDSQFSHTHSDASVISS